MSCEFLRSLSLHFNLPCVCQLFFLQKIFLSLHEKHVGESGRNFSQPMVPWVARNSVVFFFDFRPELLRFPVFMLFFAANFSLFEQKKNSSSKKLTVGFSLKGPVFGRSFLAEFRQEATRHFLMLLGVLLMRMCY